MNLKVIGSGSKGNAYLLENEEEALLIECGVGISKIKEALKFDFKKLKGCIVTHEHGDHSQSVSKLMSYGIDVHATTGTHKALSTYGSHRANCFQYREFFTIGNFKIMAFDVLHDAAEPCGFVINHKDTGNVLFLTDLIFSAYTFPNIHNIIIEANYDEDLAKRKLSDMEFLRNRIIKNHMSIDTCIKTLNANDLSKVNNIILIHLSDSNSNANDFKNRVELATGKNVSIADEGLSINFNKTPF